MYYRMLLLICILNSYSSFALPLNQVVFKQGNFLFKWDVENDHALVSNSNQKIVWQGSLLPGFWVKINNAYEFVKAAVTSEVISDSALKLNLKIGRYGDGDLLIKQESWGIRFSELNITWFDKIPAIAEMYFGVSPVNTDSASVWPLWNKPFAPDWQSFGYCVPGAKEGPVQSYFRFWDFGLSNISLGSFGPSTGSPYGAAFPRPLLYAGMGSNDGFITLGAGAIPDAAMNLRLQPAGGCFQYLYREDLWGTYLSKQRQWEEPLRITFGNNAWDAFKQYYNSFPSKDKIAITTAKALWNTWGMWKDKKYNMQPIVDFAKATDNNTLVMDDSWEEFQGAGKPNFERFPNFFDNIQYIHKKGMSNGVWETVGWISNPYKNGLSDSDLILNSNGKPCIANWNFDSKSTAYYCLDISSAKAKQFLINRTIHTMHMVKPSLLKLDFGYGLPSPDAGVPKNPDYRGERYAYELVKTIYDAAKSIDSNVVIMYYGISPLWIKTTDLVSLDDQGDLWYNVKQGHQEWSIWASLLSDKNIEVTGSSGYDWKTDDEVLLNTVILGAPGGVLAIDLDSSSLSSKYINRRLAVNKWFRKTINWYPVWLNSTTGNMNEPPALNCWGRGEVINKDSVLTVLVLRDSMNAFETKYLKEMSWNGRWAIISQDNAGIFTTSSLALIPFDAGSITLPCTKKPDNIKKINLSGEEDFTQWQWNNQQLTVTITKKDLNNTAGFLISR